MKTDKLVDAIGMIKDEYIKEAHEKGFKKFTIPWSLIGKVLTAACVLFLVINILPFNFGSYKADYSSAAGGAVAPQEVNNYYYESSTVVTDEEKTAQSEYKEDQTLVDQNKKLILTAKLDLETQDLDNTLNNITTLVNQYGGYVQNSSMYTRNNYTRIYEASIRVPADKYSQFIEEIRGNGNTTSYSEHIDDVTDSYTDINARLTALKAQEQKVMEFYQKAETIEDLMAVESRLSEIRYEIEAYEARIKNYDLLTAYSTLNIFVSETKSYTPTSTSFFSRLAQAFVNGFKNFTNSIGDLFIDVVYNIWNVIFLVVIAYLGYFIYKKLRNRRNKV